MSVIGTGVAAGVAQTQAQAEQVARRRDRQEGRGAGETRRVRELIEANMRALEEGDQADIDSSTRLHIDEQIPEHEGSAPIGRDGKNGAATHYSPSASKMSAEDFERHLDVRA